MRKTVKFDADTEILLSHGELAFKRIADKIPTARRIQIATYNVDEGLVQLLAAAAPNAEVELVTNIPNRFERYWGSAQQRAKDTINKYKALLAPGNFQASVRAFYNFENHSKLVIVDDEAYVGSANFSKASADNFEAGILFTKKETVDAIRAELFVTVRDASANNLDEKTWLYFLTIESLCDSMDEAATEFSEFVEYEHHLRAPQHERFVFSQSAASRVASLIEELSGLLEESPDDPAVTAAVAEIHVLLAKASELTQRRSLTEAIDFNEEAYAQRLIESNKEAYDENLDAVAERASAASAEEKDRLFEAAEDTIQELLNVNTQVVAAAQKLERAIAVLLANSERIDNT